MKIGKYSFGIGDRFSHQGEAQLSAITKAQKAGIEIVPVWNKSNREHTYVHSKPADTRVEADKAVKALGYNGQYFVDADHINLSNVEGFIGASDFFTLDVANRIGTPSSEEEIAAFIESCKKYTGKLAIPQIKHPFEVDEQQLRTIAGKFLAAIAEAGRIYRFIAERKGA